MMLTRLTSCRLADQQLLRPHGQSQHADTRGPSLDTVDSAVVHRATSLVDFYRLSFVPSDNDIAVARLLKLPTWKRRRRRLGQVSAGLLLFLLPSVALGQTQNLFFQPPSYAGTGQSAASDFNHDGKVDLVSADGTVALGNGDGTFTYPAALPLTGTNIAVADFNGDGKPDILLNTMVFLGNGDGTFQAPLTTIPNTASPDAVADVNGDGKPDVLVIVGGAVIVYLGKGDGTFTTTNLGYGNSGTVLTVADLNGDHKLDILLSTSSSSGSSGSPSVLLGNGDGTFHAPIFSGISVEGPIILADVNGDNKPDALVNGGSLGVLIYLGKGDGTFQDSGSGVPTSALGTFAVADVNGDGKLDLIASNQFTEIYLGNGDGTFTLKSSVFGSPPSFPSPSMILVADFNGDTKPDLALNNSILFGSGDGTFRGSPALSFGDLSDSGVGQSAATGDFNGDGSLDLVLGSSTLNNLYILLNDGNGGFVVAHTYLLPFSPQSIAVADVNKDGKLDLLLTVADPGTGALSLDVMLGNGDATFAAPTQAVSSIPFGLGQSGIADFNGDRLPDFALGSAGGVEVFIGKGDGTFTSPVVYTVPSPSAGSVVTADFTGKKIVDILVDGTVLLGKGDGTFQSPIPISGCGSTPGDVNGDGKADLIGSAAHQTPTGVQSWELDVCLSNGDGTFIALPAVGGFPKFVGFLVAGDMNGDGKTDLLQVAGELVESVTVLLGNGDGTFPSSVNAPAISSSPFVVSDLTGDGRPDLLFGLFSPAGLVTLINTGGPPIPDFLISASPLSPDDVLAGSTSTSTVSLAPSNGFNSTVSLSCAGLPAGISCAFSPSTLPGGSGSSTLTITTASSSPASTYYISIVGASSSRTHAALKSLAVTTTPPGFSLSPASSATVTLTAGQTANYMLSLASNGGFSGNVALTCSGAPAATTCAVSPSSVMVGGASPASATVTLATTKASAEVGPLRLNLPTHPLNIQSFVLLAVTGMSLLTVLAQLRRQRAQPVRWARSFAIGLVWALGLVLTSCGGGSGGGGNTTGTPAGTYTVIVTATATSGPAASTQTVKLTLVVQ
jgi:hypothetical protein